MLIIQGREREIERDPSAQSTYHIRQTILLLLLLCWWNSSALNWTGDWCEHMWHDKCHELVWEAALFLFFSQSQPHHCLPSHLHSISFFPVSFQDSYTPFPWKIITKIKFLCYWISFNHSIQFSHFMPIPMDPKDFFSTDFLEGMFSYILHQSLSLLIWSCFRHFGLLFFFGKLVLFGLKTLCCVDQALFRLTLRGSTMHALLLLSLVVVYQGLQLHVFSMMHLLRSVICNY